MGKRLKDVSDGTVVVLEGESCNIKGTIKDADGATVSSLTTLTLTLYDKASDLVINSRTNQNILNANGSSFSSGVFTIELDGSDSVIKGNGLSKGQTETHVARVTWTYSDGDSTRTGMEEYEFPVQKLASPS